MTEQDKKFLEKNSENITKLNAYIDANKDDLYLIITSPELAIWLKYIETGEILGFNETMIKYRDAKVLINSYAKVERLIFVKKTSDSIDFNMPCNCGYFNDEQHP